MLAVVLALLFVIALVEIGDGDSMSSSISSSETGVAWGRGSAGSRSCWRRLSR